jgi:hypothetical protein
MKSNNELSELIQELLILGYTLPELAENWGIHNTNLTSKYKVVNKKYKYISAYKSLKKVIYENKLKQIMASKEEPYYTNEFDYGFIPTYTFEELSFREKQFYYNNLKQNN